jgi:hypothetical protein
MMASEISDMIFAPLGQTFVVKSASSAPTGIQVKPTGLYDDLAIAQYRIYNSGTSIAYLGYGLTAASAQTNADSSTDYAAGDPGDAVPIAPGSIEILRFGVDMYFSSRSATSADIFITPGEGL